MSDGSSDYTLRTIGMNDIVQICVLLGELLQDDMTIPKIGRIEYHPADADDTDYQVVSKCIANMVAEASKPSRRGSRGALQLIEE